MVHALGIAASNRHRSSCRCPGSRSASSRAACSAATRPSAGVEIDLPEATTATVTVFDNVFQNMSDTLGVADGGGPRHQRLQGAAQPRLGGRRRALSEAKAHAPPGRVVSYTASRSTRSVGNEHFLSAFDRTHVANVAAAFDLGRLWAARARASPSTPARRSFRAEGNGLIPPAALAEPRTRSHVLPARSPAREALESLEDGVARLRPPRS